MEAGGWVSQWYVKESIIEQKRGWKEFGESWIYLVFHQLAAEAAAAAAEAAAAAADHWGVYNFNALRRNFSQPTNWKM